MKVENIKKFLPLPEVIRERVSDMRFIEQCLDTSNFRRIFKLQPYGARYGQDYFIEAYCNEIKANVYVFLRKREEPTIMLLFLISAKKP